MKILKSLIGIGIMFMSFSGMAQKQYDHAMSKDPVERAKMQTEKMTEHLGLSEIQQEQIAEINLRYAKEAQVIYEASEDKEAAKDDIRKLKKSQDGEIIAVLNEKQTAKWEEHKQKRRQQMQQKKQKQAMPDSK